MTKEVPNVQSPFSYASRVVSLCAARALSGVHEDKLKDMAECGEIPAWNIARVLNGPRREIRFLGAAIARLAMREPHNDFDEESIIHLIYGPEQASLRSTSVAASWNSDSDHICHLIRDGVLVAASTFRRGKCAEVTWASAVAFLRKRRLTSF